MNWTQMLQQQVNDVYRATEGLLELLDDDQLDWKPETGSNWMTTGQLLKHLTNACGSAMKGFVTEDWGMPEEMSEEVMLPPAEKLPTAPSVEWTRRKLAADKKLALDMIAQAGEEDLANKMVSAPWNQTSQSLGYWLSDMVAHLATHKSQLFYYLKLQGKPVHTGNMWGM